MIDIHKFSPNENGNMIGKPLKKLYLGAVEGQMAMNAMNMTKTNSLAATSSIWRKSAVKCLDPSFISFV
jgi:hypothetical protein